MTRPGEHDFPVRSATDIYSGRVMALRSDRVVMPGGRVATREILEHPGAVAVVAVDESGRVRMLHQYRHAVRRRLWELPAGLLDVAGEDPAVTADRELTEEAGLSARDWSVLLDVVPSPGFSDESVRIFLARDLVEKPRPDLGDDEEADLELRWIPIAEALGMVFSGEIVNAVSCAGLLAARAVLAGEFDPRPVDAEWVDRPFRFARRADE
ncbi:ADP-ribose pyrophosphatase [Pseudonocardia sp. Ae406_Ps2]|uniref:NUDIX domain-containing protein n=1 Tax=unclassified Pseudonocardia TaxID=2619320 RepID=UPI0003044912|nr:MULTISPECIES: NUDIX hydrolase [unclassified Pseudonocardia]KAA1024750.1 NUDIX hydrolase [Pseudonocardia sp. EV170527-09]OLM00474.1 ADP-ribose pyrophosphatase [Pseudonocardia sp. Ae406_Ps2]OLM07733.1 ADP-ribose pyrophosphatase [Pseudonocardia sp. Ae331_Ps2]OLM14021.1 ADP-ribose pyrophosphatase [Pseudonocardia sp. Ae505_Ps2]OLM22048.1 ADP-ribose pyrophosphatase [Pseudonocardia sp. Ae706_Ps2]